MLINRDGDFALVGASNVYADELERGQLAVGDGPGIESTRRGALVAVEDLAEETRWRELAKPNVRAVLSAPIWFLGRPVGNLNALCRQPHEWTTNDRRALTAYAGVITALLRVGVAAGNAEDPVVAELRLSLDAQA
jgi:GAF domain-containing protein